MTFLKTDIVQYDTKCNQGYKIQQVKKLLNRCKCSGLCKDLLILNLAQASTYLLTCPYRASNVICLHNTVCSKGLCGPVFFFFPPQLAGFSAANPKHSQSILLSLNQVCLSCCHISAEYSSLLIDKHCLRFPQLFQCNKDIS